MSKQSLEPDALQQLAHSIGTDAPDILLEIIDTFLDDSQQLVNELKNAEKNNKCEIVYRIAHTLKSSSAVMGASHLSELSEILERGLRQRLPNLDIPSQINAIEKEHLIVLAALHEERVEVVKNL